MASLLVLLAACGCTTSLTNLTPTRVLEPREAQVSVHGQAQAGTGVIGKTVRAGRAAYEAIDADAEDPIDEALLRDLVDAGLVWLLLPPGAGFEVMARVGLVDWLQGVELGLRYDTKLLKGDLKVGLLRSPDGQWALSALAGYGRHLGLVDAALSYLAMTEFRRGDLDLQLSFGFQVPDYFHAYVNPRILVSRISARSTLPSYLRNRVPESLSDYDPSRLFSDSTMTYTGLTLGAMAGYKHVFLALELNGFWLAFEPVVLGERRNFGSLVLSPAAAVVVIW
jgi:hypothetical protein